MGDDTYQFKDDSKVVADGIDGKKKEVTDPYSSLPIRALACSISSKSDATLLGGDGFVKCAKVS